jgi:alkyl sulfatase BDS1-like metallo-beta-lactamase superfamily hydrolase
MAKDVENNDSRAFRKRARKCRDIAQGAKNADWRKLLLTLARELDDEADKIDSESASEKEL